MSRATQNFAAFFPSAPRAAKDKAKERERSKSHNLDLANTRRFAESHVLTTIVGVSNATPGRLFKDTESVAGDIGTPLAEDAESISGDILNGVGSASSNTSTVSSVFSNAAQNLNMSSGSSARTASNLTPLTNMDSSPLHVTSPNQHKSGAVLTASSIANKVTPHDGEHQDQTNQGHRVLPDKRIVARDQSRTIKGIICTYDPLLDRTLGSSEKKKAKPTYKEFGVVCTYPSVGSVIFIMRGYG